MDKHDLNPHKPNKVQIAACEGLRCNPEWEMVFIYGDPTGRNLMARQFCRLERNPKDKKMPWTTFKTMYKALKEWAVKHDCKRND